VQDKGGNHLLGHSTVFPHSSVSATHSPTNSLPPLPATSPPTCFTMAILAHLTDKFCFFTFRILLSHLSHAEATPLPWPLPHSPCTICSTLALLGHYPLPPPPCPLLTTMHRWGTGQQYVWGAIASVIVVLMYITFQQYSCFILL
jgi:hypothetical protein